MQIEMFWAPNTFQLSFNHLICRENLMAKHKRKMDSRTNFNWIHLFDRGPHQQIAIA